MKTAFQRLYQTFQALKSYQKIAKFLLARLVLNDALITIFAFGGIYAAGEIGFSFEEIMILGIVLNVTAGIGAFLMGYLDDRKGSQRIVQWSILFLIVACLLAIVAPLLPLWFEDISWFSPKFLLDSGFAYRFFSGPNQAASRSLMAHYTPADKRNEFFGFYAFQEKQLPFWDRCYSVG